MTFIREMTVQDLDEVRRIYTLGWKNAFVGIVPQEYLDNMDLSDWVPPLAGAFVLTDGKTCIGTSSISEAREPNFKGWGEIISIFLLPEMIGQGYGHILFEYVKNNLLVQGYSNIYLTVFEDNIRARKFYERHGFVWNGERIPMKLDGKELIELRYVYTQNN